MDMCIHSVMQYGKTEVNQSAGEQKLALHCFYLISVSNSQLCNHQRNFLNRK